MLGFIIFSYPLSLIIGLVLGAIGSRPLVSVVSSAVIGVALATLLSLEYVSEVSFQMLFVGMILPASAVCAALGVIGAGISIGTKMLLRALRWTD